jgi:hypothetical protein
MRKYDGQFKFCHNKPISNKLLSPRSRHRAAISDLHGIPIKNGQELWSGKVYIAVTTRMRGADKLSGISLPITFETLYTYQM